MSDKEFAKRMNLYHKKKHPSQQPYLVYPDEDDSGYCETKVSNKKLVSCFKCGVKPILICGEEIVGHGQTNDYYWLECPKCKQKKEHWDEDALIAKWNNKNVLPQ